MPTPQPLADHPITDDPPHAEPVRGGSVVRELDKARNLLINTGRRNNPLIHTNRENKRAKALTILNENAEKVFETLCKQGKVMKFLATGSEDADEESNDNSLVANNQPVDESKPKDNVLKTPLTKDGQGKRLLTLFHDAETAEQEQGVNILYLAIGFLTWFEPKSSVEKYESPLILLPVDLKRGKHGFTLRRREDDIVANLPLQKRLNDDFGIKLPEIDDNDEWTPSDYFALVKEAITGQTNWQVDPDGMLIRFFSFTKFLMYLDLDPQKWQSDKSILNHEPTQKLLVDGFTSEPLLFDESESLDKQLDPKDIFHVTDADASQTKVIEEVRKGRNLVVQGPPGTGKSQTITNILAAAAFDGKKTLFVAEKLAALDVVYKRMVEANLSDICLKLHTRAHKKSVLEELKRTLNQHPPEYADCADELRDVRDQLTDATELLHCNLQGYDYNPFQAITVLASLHEFRPLDIANNLEKLTQQKYDAIILDIHNYVDALENVEVESEHPFAGVNRHDLLPPDLKRLESDIDKAAKRIDRLSAALKKISKQTGIQSINSIAFAYQLNEWIHWLHRLRFMPPVIAGVAIKLFERAGLLNTELLSVDTITTRQTLDVIRNEFKDATQLTKAVAASSDIASVIDFLQLKLPKRVAHDQAVLDDIKSRLVGMRENTNRYREWGILQSCARKLKKHKLTKLIKLLKQGDIKPNNAVNQFRYEVANARLALANKQLPKLSKLLDADRHELATKFRHCDKQHIKNACDQVRAKHGSKLLLTGDVAGMHFLKGEMNKKIKLRAIRKIMEHAGQLISGHIKPVFLMSPMSVAQFLPPGKIEFDLLVIDEASQVPPVDAFGAIARCKQIVVVGDQKQLPPTSFFDRLSGDLDDEENEGGENESVKTASASEMESILTLCEARGLNSRMLEWHYRSRDPSLIAVSNEEFYEKRLKFPPSPILSGDIGMKLKKVNGVYANGINQIEAEEIVAALAEHAENNPTQSIGVVAFSQKQSNTIYELLENARQNNLVLDEFLIDGVDGEHYFVKNIENVQGDERDVILISVGYGPEELGGRLRMNFGPVNNEGGERRLNVLFTRARNSCRIFASFTAAAMNVDNTMHAGPRVLKKFLEYAQTGKLERHEPSGKPADSPFEEDVAREIVALGYDADLQVSSAGFRIDIGVRAPDMPGSYIMAVECDGASYHSTRFARERDRLRQTVLENQDWHFHRIWSTDWFTKRDHEIKRLQKKLEDARNATNEESNPSDTDNAD